MTTQFKGTANIASDQFYDLTTLISGSASVDGYMTVLGNVSVTFIDTSSSSQPDPSAAAGIATPNNPVYVNAAHIWVKGFNGTATVQFQQIS